MRRSIAALTLLSLVATSCGLKPPWVTYRSDSCTDSDGPTADTVRLAIATLPLATPGSGWAEDARGHTRNCRLYWVQVRPTQATAVSPEQLLFFDHNSPLGTPTPNPKPHTTVLSSGDDAVRVQYRWQVAGDSACCPTGVGIVQYAIGPGGKLVTRGPVPNQ